jgi:hypothetical protein
MTLTRHRSSITGQWVTKACATRNPDTTQSATFELADDVCPEKAQVDFLLGCFLEAKQADRAEWLLEILDELNNWHKRLGEMP